MYSIKLDETKHFMGSYAMVGKIDGGVDIDSLPPEADTEKALCYKYDVHDVISIQKVPVMETNPDTGESIPKLDENGNPITEDKPITISITEWFLDEEKYNTYLENLLINEKIIKTEEINKICQDTIWAGTDVTLSDTVIKHFKFTLEDQSNIKALSDKVKDGATIVPYHVDGELCRMFTAAEINNLYAAMENFKTYNLTLCNYIKDYIKTLTTSAAITAINYNVDSMSEEYKVLFNTFMASIPA